MHTSIIIIDNLTYHCNSSDKGVDAGLFMMKLMNLKKQYGWILLIIVHTADFPHLDLKVSDLLEKHATPEARTAHIDLADWLLEYLTDKS